MNIFNIFFHQFNTLFINIRDGKDLVDYRVQTFFLYCPFPPTVVASSTKQDNNKSHEERNKFTSLTSKMESSNEACIEGGEVQGLPFLLVEL